MIRVRKARIADAEDMALLATELGYPTSTSEMVERLSALLAMNNFFIAVAEDSKNQVVGWVAVEQRLLLESGKRAEIVGLIVTKRFRRNGIGKDLVAAGEQWAVNNGLSLISVRSNEIRKESHTFYQNKGYLYKKTQHTYTKAL